MPHIFQADKELHDKIKEKEEARASSFYLHNISYCVDDDIL